MNHQERHSRALRLNEAIQQRLDCAAIMCGLGKGDDKLLDFRLHRIIVTAQKRCHRANHQGLDAPAIAAIIAAWEMANPGMPLYSN